jgi:hypothetical protein
MGDSGVENWNRAMGIPEVFKALKTYADRLSSVEVTPMQRTEQLL